MHASKYIFIAGDLKKYKSTTTLYVDNMDKKKAS